MTRSRQPRFAIDESPDGRFELKSVFVATLPARTLKFTPRVVIARKVKQHDFFRNEMSFV